MKSTIDQISSIQNQFFDLGLEFPAPLEFGKVVRIKASDDKGSKKSGWYICHEFRLDSGETVITGKIGNWKNGDDGVLIDVDWKGISEEEREKMRVQAEVQRQEAIAVKLALQAETKLRAQKIWAKLPDSGKSEYLQRKKIGAYGIRFSRGSLAVPLFNIDGELCNIQWIDKDGDKKFMTGGKKEGCFHKFGKMTDINTLIVTEGYATGASIHLATGLPVVITFDSGNIKSVLIALREKYSDVNLLIAADNDVNNIHGNVGFNKACEAAALVNAKVVVPEFEAAA